MRYTIELAREVGIPTGRIGGYDKELKAFEALVRADEREACAKVCEKEWSTLPERKYGEECADAIRARGNT